MTATASPLQTKSLEQEALPSRYKVLILGSHVVQYGPPLYRLLARDSRLEIVVAYCSMQGSESGMDPEFGIEIQWDTPLLDGYPWVHVPNKSPFPRLGHFFGLWNPGLWKIVRAGGFDAVVIYTGYMYASFWLAVLAAKSKGVPVLISSDSSSLQPRDGSRWKRWIKPFIVGTVYRTADVLMAASPPVRDLAVRLGMPPERIAIMRSGVDKDGWVEQTKKFDRDSVRASWNVPCDAVVIFYCAKLQSWKRPLDLLRAFAKVDAPNAYLVYAGEGPQRRQLKQEAQQCGVSDRVRVLGFVNVSQLPGLYKAADLFVLPSEYDPCPLVVAEAMFTGLPVILSDAVLGRLDMIHAGRSGYTYRCGDTDELAAVLEKVLREPALLESLKAGVRHQMESWTAADFLDCWVGAVETANQRKKKSAGGNR